VLAPLTVPAVVWDVCLSGRSALFAGDVVHRAPARSDGRHDEPASSSGDSGAARAAVVADGTGGEEEEMRGAPRDFSEWPRSGDRGIRGYRNRLRHPGCDAPGAPDGFKRPWTTLRLRGVRMVPGTVCASKRRSMSIKDAFSPEPKWRGLSVVGIVANPGCDGKETT